MFFQARMMVISGFGDLMLQAEVESSLHNTDRVFHIVMLSRHGTHTCLRSVVSGATAIFPKL